MNADKEEKRGLMLPLFLLEKPLKINDRFFITVQHSFSETFVLKHYIVKFHLRQVKKYVLENLITP